VSDVVLAACTLLGPIFAVQAQKWVERLREKNARKLAIFRTLMGTRATALSPAHVEALNAVPIDFYKDRPIMDAWETYYGHLCRKGPADAVWIQKQVDLFVTLLVLIGKRLGYDFNAEQMHKIYHPTAHNTIEEEWNTIRSGTAGLFTGKSTLPLSIKDFPSDPETARAQRLILQKLAKAYTDDGSLRVSVENGEIPPAPAQRPAA
jgi:hypothetical protein